MTLREARIAALAYYDWEERGRPLDEEPVDLPLSSVCAGPDTSVGVAVRR